MSLRDMVESSRRAEDHLGPQAQHVGGSRPPDDWLDGFYRTARVEFDTLRHKRDELRVIVETQNKRLESLTQLSHNQSGEIRDLNNHLYEAHARIASLEELDNVRSHSQLELQVARADKEHYKRKAQFYEGIVKASSDQVGSVAMKLQQNVNTGLERFGGLIGGSGGAGPSRFPGVVLNSNGEGSSRCGARPSVQPMGKGKELKFNMPLSNVEEEDPEEEFNSDDDIDVYVEESPSPDVIDLTYDGDNEAEEIRGSKKPKKENM